MPPGNASARPSPCEVALAEIDAVDPQPGEDESLKAEAVKLANVEELRIAATTAHQALIAEDFGDGKPTPRPSSTPPNAPWSTLPNTTRSSAPRPPGWPRWASCSTTSPPNSPATRPPSTPRARNGSPRSRTAAPPWRSWSASTLRASTRCWCGPRRPGNGSWSCRTTPPGSRRWTPRSTRAEAELVKQAAAISKLAEEGRQGPLRPRQRRTQGPGDGGRHPGDQRRVRRASRGRTARTRFPSCSSRTPAPRPGRWARAPPAVNCPA